jgi:hypothetical protein
MSLPLEVISDSCSRRIASVDMDEKHEARLESEPLASRPVCRDESLLTDESACDGEGRRIYVKHNQFKTNSHCHSLRSRPSPKPLSSFLETILDRAQTNEALLRNLWVL